MLCSVHEQIWKTQQWSQNWKKSVFIPIPKKGNFKECSNYNSIAVISCAGKVMLKILQARLQQYMNWELQMYKLGFEGAKKPEIKLSTFTSLWRKQRSSRKHLLLFHWLAKLFDYVDHNKLWENSLRDGSTRPPYLSPEKVKKVSCNAGQETTVRTRHGAMDWLQIGKGVQ